MSRLSDQEVDTLRSWFVLTMAMYATKQLRSPDRPQQWMVLVYLAIHDGSAAYKKVRQACGFKSAPALSQVVTPLEEGQYVTRRRSRESHLTLDEPGWSVIEEILKARPVGL
jgi:DNA-binding MarR family transcriptional regulator